MFFLAIGMWSLGTRSAHAGAWTREPGSFEVISTVSYHSGYVEFDDSGVRNDLVDFSKFESVFFIEYGILENWSAMARLVLQQVSVARGAMVDEAQGLGATELSLKRNLGQFKDWVFAAQGRISIPGDAENRLDLRLGEGNLEWEVRGLVGHSFALGNTRGFVDLQLARQFRIQPNADEWHLDMTIGYRPTATIMTMAQVFVLRGDEVQTLAARTLASTKVQGSLVWFFKPHHGIQLYAAKMIDGRNTIADRTIGIGYWFDF
ncbi:MAG: hypothetical protein COA47_03855 [Robiginitomaculum sp.]|nr:MAG: hypothetical protein COA47_03855 [Robiginitomaculum sp.]